MNSRSEDGAVDNDGNGSVPESILRRVRALLSRAEHESTPTPEREVSRKLAFKLMKRHSISLDMLAATGRRKDEVVSEGVRHEHRGPIRIGWADLVSIWIRCHSIEIAVVGVLFVLTVAVSAWFAVATGAAVLWWVLAEYRTSRTYRE